MILDPPDDGVGAWRLLRGVILRQDEPATCKLVLLSCIARITDTSPSVAREAGDDVELPLGLIALACIRVFKPLVEQALPQLSGERMRFVKDGFRALRPISPQELRPGAVQAEHCLPWSAWACNDLWKLLPASREANQRKSGLIVAAGTLAEGWPRILVCWEEAHLDADAATRARFAKEARTTRLLPQEGELALENPFAALDFRRLRLRQETQLPEWAGVVR